MIMSTLLAAVTGTPRFLRQTSQLHRPCSLESVYDMRISTVTVMRVGRCSVPSATDSFLFFLRWIPSVHCKLQNLDRHMPEFTV